MIRTRTCIIPALIASERVSFSDERERDINALCLYSITVNAWSVSVPAVKRPNRRKTEMCRSIFDQEVIEIVQFLCSFYILSEGEGLHTEVNRASAIMTRHKTNDHITISLRCEERSDFWTLSIHFSPQCNKLTQWDPGIDFYPL